MNLISISKKKDRKILINVIQNKNKISNISRTKFQALEEGTFFTRDLVSEPGNVLHPDEYAKRLNLLKKMVLRSVYTIRKC